MASFFMIRFCIVRMIIAVSVPIHTVMMDNVHGFAFCKSSTPVSEYPKGLSTGGTRGAKNVTIHKINSCRIILYMNEDKVFLS